MALIERLCRTLKDTLGLRLLRPLVAEDLMEKIGPGLVHYPHFRLHQVSAVRRRQRSTSDGRQRISPRSRRLAAAEKSAGRALVRTECQSCRAAPGETGGHDRLF